MQEVIVYTFTGLVDIKVLVTKDNASAFIMKADGNFIPADYRVEYLMPSADTEKK